MSVSRDEVIRLLAISIGITAGIVVKPEALVDRCLHEASKFMTWWNGSQPTSQAMASTNPPSPHITTISNFVTRVGNFIDQTAYKIQWKDALIQFDEQSPISHLTLVRIATAALAIPVARVTLRVLTRKR